MGKKRTKKEIYEKILEKCIELDCSKVNVVDMRTRVILICNKHGEYAKTPYQILYKNYNCPICTQINKVKKIKSTKKEKYGDENYNNIEKIKQTCLDKFGVDNVFKLKDIHQKGITASQSNESKEKRKQTNLELYGHENPFGSTLIKDKIKMTNIVKYGVKSYSQTDEFKAKLKETCLSKFGVESNLNLPEIKEKVKKRINTHEARVKASNTMRKNGNKSQLETIMENFFIQNDISYILEYNKDPRYPFHCDFYLPTIDTFIEINGYWAHGGHWFDKNNIDDIIKLNEWKLKSENSDLYQRAIEIWTKKDLEKYKYAIDNNLNYIVLWNIQDINNFIENWNWEVVM